MPDELELDLDEDAGQPKEEHPIDKRLTKVLQDREAARKDAEEKAKLAKESEAKRLEAEKERDFFKNFAPLIAKQPSAAEFQDKILEKVKAGYDLEDATNSVLIKEGKFTPPAASPQPKTNPAGGSAPNQIPMQDNKPVKEMTLQEKLDALREAERRGDIGFS